MRGEKEGGAVDGDENGEKNEAEGKWSDACGSRMKKEQGEERREKRELEAPGERGTESGR